MRCWRSSTAGPGLAPIGEQVPPAIAAASYGRERWYVSPEQRRREAERLRGRADDDAAVVPPASILFEADPWETTAHVSKRRRSEAQIFRWTDPRRFTFIASGEQSSTARGRGRDGTGTKNGPPRH